jgi:hypothetical protein
MPASDYLKEARDDGYPATKSPQKADDDDPDESPTTSRIIKLSDEEMKQFQNSSPGQELECTVRGNLEEDGHFHVMSVSAPQGGYGGKSAVQGQDSTEQMAQKVAMLVRPQLQISPSG